MLLLCLFAASCPWGMGWEGRQKESRAAPQGRSSCPEKKTEGAEGEGGHGESQTPRARQGPRRAPNCLKLALGLGLKEGPPRSMSLLRRESASVYRVYVHNTCHLAGCHKATRSLLFLTVPFPAPREHLRILINLSRLKPISSATRLPESAARLLKVMSFTSRAVSEGPPPEVGEHSCRPLQQLSEAPSRLQNHTQKRPTCHTTCARLGNLLSNLPTPDHGLRGSGLDSTVTLVTPHPKALRQGQRPN